MRLGRSNGTWASYCHPEGCNSYKCTTTISLYLCEVLNSKWNRQNSGKFLKQARVLLPFKNCLFSLSSRLFQTPHWTWRTGYIARRTTHKINGLQCLTNISDLKSFLGLVPITNGSLPNFHELPYCKMKNLANENLQNGYN